MWGSKERPVVIDAADEPLANEQSCPILSALHIEVCRFVKVIRCRREEDCVRMPAQVRYRNRCERRGKVLEHLETGDQVIVTLELVGDRTNAAERA